MLRRIVMYALVFVEVNTGLTGLFREAEVTRTTQCAFCTGVRSYWE